MDKIILKLLQANGRVIIPDFGALIVKQKSPFTVIFNEFLQYNDGALIGAISADLNLEREVAATKVRDLTKELQDKLANEEEVNLSGIGILVKSSTGKITLKDTGSSPSTPPTTETKKGTSTPPIPPPKATPPKEESKTVEFDLEDDNKPEVKPPEKKEIPKPAPKKEIPGGIPQPTPKKELPKSPPKRDLPTPPPPKKEEPASTSVDTPPISEYYTENNGKSKRNIALWIILILLINGTIIGFFIYRHEIKDFFASNKDNTQTEAPIIIEEEESSIGDIDTTSDSNIIEQETEPVIESTTETVEESQPNQETFAGTKYYVVAGVFSEEANANRLVSELRNKGYNAEKFAKIGRMHAVSYDVFPNKRDADRLMLKIQREIDANAWIKIID